MDWAGLLRLGLGTLRLRPGEFWAMTPMEFLMCLGLDADRMPLTRTGLEALLRAHPDQGEDVDHDHRS